MKALEYLGLVLVAIAYVHLAQLDLVGVWTFAALGAICEGASMAWRVWA